MVSNGVLWFFTWLACLPLPQSSDRTAEILRLVPDDAQLVIVIQNLRDVWQQAETDLFSERLGEMLLNDDIIKGTLAAQLKRSLLDLAATLGTDAQRLRDDVCGDSLVFAYGSHPAEKGRGEYALLFSWCRDVRVANRIRTRVDVMQRKSGELKSLRSLPYGDGQIIERIKTQGPSDFVTQMGPIFILSNSELAVREVMDRRQNSRSNAFQPLWQRVTTPRDFVIFWLNPRGFDSELAQRAQSAREEERAFLQTFTRLWAAIDAVAISLEWGAEKAASLSVAYRREDLPKEWRRWLESQASLASSRLELRGPWWALARLPVDLSNIRDAVRTLLPNQSWEELTEMAESVLLPFFGRKRTKEFLSHFSSPWTLYVAPPMLENSPLPEIALAIPLAEAADSRFERQLQDAMDAFLLFLRLQLGVELDDPIQSNRKVGENGTEIRFLHHEKLFPRGVQPAYSVQKRHLIFATSPRIIDRLSRVPAEERKRDGILAEVRLKPLLGFLAPTIDEWLKPFGKLSDDPGETNVEIIRRAFALAGLFDHALITLENRNDQVVRGSFRFVPKPPKP